MKDFNKIDIREAIHTCIKESKCGEISDTDNLNSTVERILDIINYCQSCGSIHSDGTRNNCI